MIDVETVNAASTITLLEAIEVLYPMLALIHLFLDNARYHQAKLVQDWLAQPDHSILIPTGSPIRRCAMLVAQRGAPVNLRNDS
jgi:hypothetical protein